MSGIKINTARKATWKIMDKTTVQGLFVFFGFGLDTTISSNMVTLPPPGRRETPRGARTCAGFTAGCRSGTGCKTLAPPAIPRDHHRCGDAKTGVRSYHNPDH